VSNNETIESLKSEYQQKIDELKCYYENIIALMPGHVYWQDKNNVFLGCNNLQAENAGLHSREDIVGKTNHDMLWKDQADHLDQINNKVMSERRPYVVEEYADMSSGSGVFLTQKVPMQDSDGDVIGVLGISFDITERKRQEEELRIAKQKAEAANGAKTNFLAMMSHELSTPLNVMMGLVQILQKQVANSVQKQLLNVILQSGEGLSALINDILDFSKIEAGKLRFNKATFNLPHLVSDIVFGAKTQVIKKDVSIVTNIDDAIPAWFFADKFRIRQVLVNLIGNAIKFTGSGVIELCVSLLGVQESIATLKFVVKDTGIGIPEDKRAEIFERFTQVNSDYSRPFEGLGLGLSICKQLVEAMDGEIGVASQLQLGSEFWFTLPLELIESSVNSISLEKNGNVTEFKTDINDKKLNANALLVEDNELNQLVAKVMLEDFGCTVDVAGTGEEAVECYLENAYDLILTDISLPKMDGFEVIAKIQSTEKYQQMNIPIFALTAHRLAEDQQRCLDAGACDVLTKPIKQEVLYDSIRKFVKRKQ